MKKIKKKTTFILVFALMLRGNFFYSKASDIQYRSNIQVFVDGEEVGLIPAIENNYENNLFVSLKGMAYALHGTSKAFSPVVEKRKITITTETDYTVLPDEWDEKALNGAISATAGKYELYVDESERKYYSFILSRNKDYDAFLPPLSMAMMFDVDMEVTRGRIEINTEKPFAISAEQLEASGYMQGVNALLVGDGTTGEIYYQYDMDEVVPIASTTKLMTYYVFMEAVSRGECSMTDTVVISERASKLSVGSDGVIPLQKGSVFSMTDLLYGMLLCSSNECALAIAEHVAGSEEAFVAEMNAQARELGLSNTEFYNCHGLPYYEDQFIPAKMQNHMTAEEMFRFASVLMAKYPQVTDITSVQTYELKTLAMEAKNSNALLYNMENAVGLKTGTTNKAGACLVTCVEAMKYGEPHHLIVVLFGAEGDSSRGLVSEIAARYAVNALLEGAEVLEIPSRNPGQTPAENVKVIPKDPEAVIQKLITLNVPSAPQSHN